MARQGRYLLLAAVLLFGALPFIHAAAADDDHEKKVLNLLAVQKALQEGRDALKRGDYQAAVTVLESHIAFIDGKKEYLDALRDAYLGYLRELKQSNRSAEIPPYIRRLECIDPGAVLELNATHSAPVTNPPPQPLVAASIKTTDIVAQSDHAAKARAILDQAEKEFAANRFVEAGRLYEQVNRIDPAIANEGKEKWAYCNVYAVWDALDRAPAGAPAPPEWERDLRQALALAPSNQRLGDFGKTLLGKIQERRGPAIRAVAPDETPGEVEVRHTARQADQNYAMAETVNFRLFHNQSRETAEKTLRTAEAARTAASKKWFGQTAATWSPRCDIYLHATAQHYSLATGQPPELAGHSSIEHKLDRIVSRRIDIHFDDPNMLIGVLPHETTHVVLADGYTRPLPHWADEGMAVLSEPRERIERHLHNLPQHRSNGETFAAAELIPMDQYPGDRQRIGAFYAESVSLVEFLSKEKGAPVFVKFMREGMQNGYEPALQKYYDIHGYDDLEQRWQRYAFGGLAQRE
jgi:tetratricopeptide (TPR) repeat protein